MTTASELITDALGDILVNASESPIQADDMQSAIRAMNRLIASWDLALGYTTVSNPNDVLTVISGAELAIQKNLSVSLAPLFDGFVSPALGLEAKSSLNDLLNLVVCVQPSTFPNTLPRGSGNYEPLSDTAFYPDEGDALIQEGDGNILLE